MPEELAQATQNSITDANKKESESDESDNDSEEAIKDPVLLQKELQKIVDAERYKEEESGETEDVDEEEEYCKEKEDYEDIDDLLVKHIKKKNLPVLKTESTPGDGNCWYRCAAYQVRRLKISGVPRGHGGLRAAVSFKNCLIPDLLNLPAQVCAALPGLNHALEWLNSMFKGRIGKLTRFLDHHKKPGQWTDSKGIMCQVGSHVYRVTMVYRIQATALYLKRHINIVSTINTDPGDRGFTRCCCYSFSGSSCARARDRAHYATTPLSQGGRRPRS